MFIVIKNNKIVSCIDVVHEKYKFPFINHKVRSGFMQITWQVDRGGVTGDMFIQSCRVTTNLSHVSLSSSLLFSSLWNKEKKWNTIVLMNMRGVSQAKHQSPCKCGVRSIWILYKVTRSNANQIQIQALWNTSGNITEYNIDLRSINTHFDIDTVARNSQFDCIYLCHHNVTALTKFALFSRPTIQISEY